MNKTKITARAGLSSSHTRAVGERPRLSPTAVHTLIGDVRSAQLLLQDVLGPAGFDLGGPFRLDFGVAVLGEIRKRRDRGGEGIRVETCLLVRRQLARVD